MCVAVLSVAFAMPTAPSEKPTEVEPKENMKTAETSHLHLLPGFSFGFGGIPSLVRGGINIGIYYYIVIEISRDFFLIIFLFTGIGGYGYGYPYGYAAPAGYYGDYALNYPTFY